MFDVGKLYVLTMRDPDENATLDWLNCKVLEIELPLIKVDRDGDILTVNTASPDFITARPQ